MKSLNRAAPGTQEPHRRARWMPYPPSSAVPEAGAARMIHRYPGRVES
ncbi:hypothetical protein [Lysobacter gummosus]